MGRSVNKVIVVGNLGRDPEIRFMPNGNAVANVSVGTDESYTDKQSGQKVEQTEWHRITAYGKLAEIIQQYLKKGSKVYFEGKLRTRKYEKDAIERFVTEIIASDMLMLDSRQQNAMGQPQPQQPPQHPSLGQSSQGQPGHHSITQSNQAQPAPGTDYSQPQAPGNAFGDFDDDVPF